MTKRLAMILGDGIGREVMPEAEKLIETYRRRGLRLELQHFDLGADRYLRDGTTLPEDTLRTLASEYDAILLGALGDPRVPDMRHAEAILFGLRRGLDLYANVRPVRTLAERLCTLRLVRPAAIDFVVFRENTEGLYAGVGRQLARGTADEVAINEDVNTRKGVERILHAAFGYARAQRRRRVHLADKSNALRYAHELWQRVFREVAAAYPEIEARHLYIDALCARLIQAPDDFDVIVTNNLFGDILSDLGAALVGGLGLAASANLHFADPARPGLFEPVHGSAPDIAGQRRANPCAALLSTALCLEHLGYPEERLRIERAVEQALSAGACTADVGGTLDTEAAGAAVRERLRFE